MGALICASGPVVGVVVVDVDTGIEVEIGVGVDVDIEDDIESFNFGMLISSLLFTKRIVDCEEGEVVERRVVGDVGEVGESASPEFDEKGAFELDGSCVVSSFEEESIVPVEGVGTLILILDFVEIGVVEILVEVGTAVEDGEKEVVVAVGREPDVPTSSRLGRVNLITLSGFVVFEATLSLSVSERFRFLLALVEFVVVKFGVVGVGDDVLVFPLFFALNSSLLN